MQRHILFKLTKIKHKEQILKAAREIVKAAREKKKKTNIQGGPH